ncbi:MAG: flagellar export chaperone FlgN [Chromatiales bacterium]|nr:flagellar export chaperone FlgN [Chromatiales bacterium]
MSDLPPTTQPGRELALLRAVRDCLLEERAALERREAAALVEVSQRKGHALAELAALRQHQPGQQPSCSERELRLLAEECHSLNEENGRMIRAQKRRVESALGLLRTGSTAADAYGQDGAPRYARSPVLQAAC